MTPSTPAGPHGSRIRRGRYTRLLVSALAAAGLAAAGTTGLVPASQAVPAATAPAASINQVTVTPNPWYASGPFQGWGTSLVWFANATGDYPEELRSQLYDLLFSQEDGLGLTIARYNIGGGNASDVPSYLRAGGAVDGYWRQDADGSTGLYGGSTTNYVDKSAVRANFDATDDAYYDWDKDSTQRWWLEKLVQDDNLTGLEAFANSAPWFMTESGYVSGGFNSTAQQLSSDAVQQYVQYLVHVTEHLEDQYGATFNTLDPFNEPNTNYWGTGIVNGQPSARQEGMHVGAAQQATVIDALQKALEDAGSDTAISAMDETNTPTFVNNWTSYPSSIRDAVTQMNVHTYWSPTTEQVRDLARSADKKLWMSEVEGNWDSTGFNPSSTANALGFAGKIADDLNGLQPNAWVLWQPVEDYYNMQLKEKLNWGEIDIDFDCQYYDTVTDQALGTTDSAPDGHGSAFLSDRRVADNGGRTSGVEPCRILLNSKFNVLRNYTNFIRPGDSLVPTNDTASTAAIGADGTSTTVVHRNESTSAQTVTIDLSKFAAIAQGASATAYVSTTPNSSDGTPSEIMETGLVAQDPVAVDADAKSVTLTVPAQSVTTIVVDGVSGTSADTGVQSGTTYQLIGVQSDLALSATTSTDGKAGVSVVTPATTASAAKAQTWTLHEAGRSAISGARSYVLQSASGKVLTSASSTVGTGGGTVSASDLTLEQASSDPSALWTIGSTDGTRTTFVNQKTAQPIEVGGQSRASGAAVDVWPNNGGDNQLWTLRSTTPTGSEPATAATPAGTSPTLPTTVIPTYSWGAGAPAPVAWDEVPDTTWATPGLVTLTGTATDIFGNTLPATVKVAVGAFTVTDPTSMTVASGTTLAAVRAAAPTIVDARVGTDPETIFEAPVVWDWSGLGDSSFAQAGVVTVTGTAESNDTDAGPLKATLSVIVLDGTLSSTNLCATGNSVTVVAVYTEGNYKPANTCDGNTNTYWSDWVSGGRSANSLTYSLGASRQISSVTVTSTERAPQAVTVKYLDDAGQWVATSAGQVSGLTTSAPTTVSFDPVSTTRVRVELVENYYAKISEVAINTHAAASDVATLAALRLGATSVEGFSPETTEYSLDTPAQGLPTVVAVPTDKDAQVSITQPSADDPRATVTVVAADGRTSKTYTVTFTDRTAPVVTLTATPGEPDGRDGWYVTTPSVEVAATDNQSEESTIEYRLVDTGTDVAEDDTEWTAYTTAVGIPEGEHTLQVRSTDEAGNVSTPVSASFRVDTTAPEVSATLSGRTVTLSGSDANTITVQYALGSGAWTGYEGPFSVPDSATTVSYRAIDAAGNTSGTKTLDVEAVPTDPDNPTPTPTPTAPSDGTGQGQTGGGSAGTGPGSGKGSGSGTGLARTGAEQLLPTVLLTATLAAAGALALLGRRRRG